MMPTGPDGTWLAQDLPAPLRDELALMVDRALVAAPFADQVTVIGVSLGRAEARKIVRDLLALRHMEQAA